jgi:beta-glucosidase
MDCSELLQNNLMKAIQQGLISQTDIDAALKPSLSTLFKLGFFDEPSINPYNKLGTNSVNSQEHQNLSRIVAQQSMVLLKNNAGILPLKMDKYKSMMVIGPNAGTIAPLLGNYHGIAGNMVSFVEGITNAVGSGTLVQYEQGCDNMDTSRFSGIWAASLCDISIAVVGLSPVLEGEEHDAFLSDGGGDKVSLELPYAQIKLLKQLKQNGKPIVVIVTAGSNINIAAIEPYADAILLAWYPGEQGGNAAADILLGKVSPSGRLPVTFYNALSDLPSYDNYSMAGRTYRYFKGEPKYPFGFGLSYTSFQYKWNTKPILSEGNMCFSIDLINTGKLSGDEVVQVYIKYPPEERMPIKELKAFKRVTVSRNGSRTVNFKINANELQKWDLKNNSWKIYPGEYQIVIAGNAADEKLVSTINMSN